MVGFRLRCLDSFGPASAATWGGIGSVIGYSLGTAFPMIALIFLGTKIRKIFPKGRLLQNLLNASLVKIYLN
jgi:hypothetical protein